MRWRGVFAALFVATPLALPGVAKALSTNVRDAAPADARGYAYDAPRGGAMGALGRAKTAEPTWGGGRPIYDGRRSLPPSGDASMSPTYASRARHGSAWRSRVMTGRAKDPELFADSVNLYAVNANDPINNRGPTGRTAETFKECMGTLGTTREYCAKMHLEAAASGCSWNPFNPKSWCGRGARERAVGAAGEAVRPLGEAAGQGLINGVSTLAGVVPRAGVDADFRARGGSAAAAGGRDAATLGIELAKLQAEGKAFEAGAAVAGPALGWLAGRGRAIWTRLIRGGQVEKAVEEFGAASSITMPPHIPEGATTRLLRPDPSGGAQYGIEYKWVNEQGQTVRFRAHGPDGLAPAGSNAAQGPVYRVQVGKNYLDAEGNMYPRGVSNPDSPFYDPVAADATHIPFVWE